MAGKLTAKTIRFGHEYIIDLNATQAAIRAGYSNKTAYSQGQRLLKKVEVQKLIQKLKAKRSERTQNHADFVLERLREELDADVADLYEADGTLKSVHDWPKVWRTGLLAGLDVEEEFHEGKKTGRSTKVKLTQRTRIMELYGKHVDIQAFTEKKKIELDATDGLAALMGAIDGKTRTA